MERRLTTILAADVVGYVRLMGRDEAGTLRQLKKLRTDLVDRKIAEHKGRIVKTTGDGVLAEFPSVVGAVACAVEMQRGMQERCSDISPERRIEFRVGVNVGDLIVEGEDLYGDGLNVAVRLESIARPGGIAVSQAVRDHIGNRLDLNFQDRGEQILKNIETPIRVYDVILEEADLAGPIPIKTDRPSVVVLPFNNMSGDAEQEYFSDGITEDLITDLSKISGLLVVARHTAFTYKDKSVKVKQLGQELGVDYVLEGSVRKAGSRVRVTGQLINSQDGGHLWADRFDRDLTDIFAIQDEITHAIVDQLRVQLLPQEKKSIAQTPTDNVEAYTYYLMGRELLYRSSTESFKRAREMFRKAVALDPSYARAWAGIADSNTFLYLRTLEQLSVDDIFAASERALALDNNLAEAHASRGAALTADQRYSEAATEFEKAINLDPNSFEAYYFYARACIFEGKLEQAAHLMERAAAAKPDDYQCVNLLGQLYNSLGRHEDAREAARRGAKLAEQHLISHPDDARAAELGGSSLVELGETDRAREWLARALELEPDNPPTLYNCACLYAKLGEIDKAFALLDHGVTKAGPEWARWIEHDSTLDPIRSDPRYQKLLEKSRNKERK